MLLAASLDSAEMRRGGSKLGQYDLQPVKTSGTTMQRQVGYHADAEPSLSQPLAGQEPCVQAGMQRCNMIGAKQLLGHESVANACSSSLRR